MLHESEARGPVAYLFVIFAEFCIVDTEQGFLGAVLLRRQIDEMTSSGVKDLLRKRMRTCPFQLRNQETCFKHCHAKVFTT